MSQLPLGSNANFIYRLGVTPVAAIPGQHSLEVTSQWLGAKDRRAKNRQLQILLPRTDVQNLRDYLDAYLRMAP